MLGMMQGWPLTVDRILDHAARWHGSTEVVARSTEGPVVRTSYGEVHRRAKQVSAALLGMGVRPGDRVATLAWNTHRHLETWYGIMGIGAVCHTLNPRLHPDQICWIINHAEDRFIFVDAQFAPMLAERWANAPSVERLVVLTDAAHRPEGLPAEVLTYEELIDGMPLDTPWGGFPEESACGLCYTSGTTGDPKGVLYSHRSNFLHTLAGLQKDLLGLSGADVILPGAPLYHANAWGIAFAAPAVGAKLVMPGARLDGPSMYELLESERVTVACGVPTIWQGVLQHMAETGGRFSTLKRVLTGGSAFPEGLMQALWRHGVTVTQIWGMTETSPIGTAGEPQAAEAALPYEAQMPTRLKQGHAQLLCDIRIVDDQGRDLPHDGQAFGRLLCKGPIVSSGYFKGSGQAAFGEDGWFDTGDVATIDPNGYMQITDRAKDVIKSGGEWISSVEIENIAMSHPKAALAAVIGVPHPRWDERPLLLVKLKEGEAATCEEFFACLEGRIAKWWTPDEVLFVDDIPLGATGKIDKKVIRAAYAGYRLPTA